MRGLTILQPYLGMKVCHTLFGPECDRSRTVEFRNRPTNIREVIALRAGVEHIPCSTCPIGGRGDCDECWPRCYDQPEAHPAEWAMSAIVATAELVDCRPPLARDLSVPGCDFKMVAPGEQRWAWVFTDLFVLPKPVAYKPPRGAQTWFHLPEDVEAEVLRQTAREGKGGTR